MRRKERLSQRIEEFREMRKERKTRQMVSQWQVLTGMRRRAKIRFKMVLTNHYLLTSRSVFSKWFRWVSMARDSYF
jgi:hypothetical protein